MAVTAITRITGRLVKIRTSRIGLLNITMLNIRERRQEGCPTVLVYVACSSTTKTKKSKYIKYNFFRNTTCNHFNLCIPPKWCTRYFKCRAVKNCIRVQPTLCLCHVVFSTTVVLYTSGTVHPVHVQYYSNSTIHHTTYVPYMYLHKECVVL